MCYKNMEFDKIKHKRINIYIYMYAGVKMFRKILCTI